MRVRSLTLLLGVTLGVLGTLRPGSSGLAARSADEERVEALLSRMSLREKAGQMVVPWIEGALEPGSAAYRRAERLVRVHRVGGFIVGKGSRTATASAIARLQSRSALPLLIGADLEWGAGMRLLGASLLPVAMAVGAAGDTALAFEHGRATALEARASGVNMVFAPVLDVNVEASNPVINTRSFGADPKAVAALGTAVARGLASGGVLAVGKHFPGHGDTDLDSHIALPVLAASRARLDSVELVPFRAAVRGGIAGIMTAHIAVPALDGERVPATLSRAVMTGLLRDALGYDGLIITDALNMAGVTRNREGSAVALLAVLAGADILLQPPNAELAIDAIVEGVRRGDISRARLDASVRRILRAKSRAGLLDDDASIAAHPDPKAVSALADTIAARSLTLRRDSDSLLPVARGARVLSLSFARVSVPGGPNEALDYALRSSGMTVTRKALPTRRLDAIADSLVDAWSREEPPLVILSTYAQPVPGLQTTGLPTGVAAALDRIARAAPTIHVVFGDPWVSSDVPSAKAVVLAWSGIPAAQRAVARAVMGKAEITGSSPVRLE